MENKSEKIAKDGMVFIFKGREFDASTGVASLSYSIKGGKEAFEFTEKFFFPDMVMAKARQPKSHDMANYDTAEFRSALDALALAAGLSYWKLFCPRKIEVAFATLSAEQASFWNTLYTKGMGEFFYKNSIDFRGLVEFPHDTGFTKPVGASRPLDESALLMVGGGKDSIVSLELLKRSGIPFTQFVLGGDPVKEQVMKVSSSSQPPIVVKRQLDPLLFELNKRSDVYNGHVPITAIVQAAAVCAASLCGVRYVVASNEGSANYGNVEYLGQEINHQWSKSAEYEKLWQDHVDAFITRAGSTGEAGREKGIVCFSLLRPLSEVKIIELFSRFSQYFGVFSSCNKNFTINKAATADDRTRWCGQCPKCAFVFAGLAAFIPKKQVKSIFGSQGSADDISSRDLFSRKELIPLCKELLGLENSKPFECVGTPEEVKLMMYLANKRMEYEHDPVMQMFKEECGGQFAEIEESRAGLLGVDMSAKALENIPPLFKSVLNNMI